ncbi:hypothetical protein LSH36_266g04055 [Paralvinella palmiformis]|uniref:Uncharacterized protein n=1 Tax=Paralvinella palmiformis TaxID=53620 RepID=A0AAD9JKR8_9ANNE|nr:hypothetical protein LSH36_266g04055 [Paralvinella palmiformis]
MKSPECTPGINQDPDRESRGCNGSMDVRGGHGQGMGDLENDGQQLRHNAGQWELGEQFDPGHQTDPDHEQQPEPTEQRDHQSEPERDCERAESHTDQTRNVRTDVDLDPPVNTTNPTAESTELRIQNSSGDDLSNPVRTESQKPAVPPKPKWLIGCTLPLNLPTAMTDSVIEEITDQPSALPSVSPLPVRRRPKLVRCQSLNVCQLRDPDVDKDCVSGLEAAMTPLTPGPYPKGHRSAWHFNEHVFQRSLSTDTGLVFSSSHPILQLKRKNKRSSATAYFLLNAIKNLNLQDDVKSIQSQKH